MMSSDRAEKSGRPPVLYYTLELETLCGCKKTVVHPCIDDMPPEVWVEAIPIPVIGRIRESLDPFSWGATVRQRRFKLIGRGHDSWTYQYKEVREDR